jgi:hypothetical protein
MTTTLDYNINVLKLQHFKDYIRTNYPSLTINYIVTNSASGNNSVSIEFNETLTTTQKNLINTTVYSYVNDTSNTLDFLLAFPLNQIKFNSTSFTNITDFIYRPTQGNLQEISPISMKNSLESFTYSIRVIDLTNAKLIGEITGLSNSIKTKNIISSLTNLPDSESIFEIQAKLDSANTFGCSLYSFELHYFQV